MSSNQPPAWTMTEIAEVEKWWVGGRSAREIAAHVHKSKSAVVSLVKRHGWYRSPGILERLKEENDFTGVENDSEHIAWMHYWRRSKAERQRLAAPPAVAACAESSFFCGGERNFALPSWLLRSA